MSISEHFWTWQTLGPKGRVVIARIGVTNLETRVRLTHNLDHNDNTLKKPATATARVTVTNGGHVMQMDLRQAV